MLFRSSFLQEVHGHTVMGLVNQDFPFDRLVSNLNMERDVNRNPLFDTVFQVQYYEERNKELEDLFFTPYDYKKNNSSQFELELLAEEEASRIRFQFVYSSALYSVETIRAIWGQFFEVLTSVVCHEDIRLGDIGSDIRFERQQEIAELDNKIQFNF